MKITLAYSCLFILLLILINFLLSILSFNLYPPGPKFQAPPSIIIIRLKSGMYPGMAETMPVWSVFKSTQNYYVLVTI